MQKLLLIVILTTCAALDARADDRVAKLEAKIQQLELRILQSEIRIQKLEALLSKGSAKPIQVRPGDYLNKANWRKLKKGMSKDQVKAILGDPPKVSASSIGDRWDYPRISDAYVSFNTRDLVTGWVEPN